MLGKVIQNDANYVLRNLKYNRKATIVDKTSWTFGPVSHTVSSMSLSKIGLIDKYYSEMYYWHSVEELNGYK